jgi:hypothetical protein
VDILYILLCIMGFILGIEYPEYILLCSDGLDFVHMVFMPVPVLVPCRGFMSASVCNWQGTAI